MKFGKTTDIEQVDFKLPPDPYGTRHFLSGLEDSDQPAKLYIGCTGWSMKEWVGKVYPDPCKSSEYLRFYCRQFNTIELNTTHYRIPDAKTIARWKSESTTDFRFCPKIPQAISHSKDLGYGDEKIAAFCDSISGLEEKLGCCFMQLPPYFGPDKSRVLQYFLKYFPPSIPLAIELRHHDWFRKSEPGKELFEILEEKHFATVITDVAGRRDVLHQRLTAPRVVIRFVGNGLHPTDFSRIDEWVERMGDWFSGGLREVYFFTHEPDNILAPDLADYLCRQVLRRLPEVETRGPRLTDPTQGQQISLF